MNICTTGGVGIGLAVAFAMLTTTAFAATASQPVLATIESDNSVATVFAASAERPAFPALPICPPATRTAAQFIACASSWICWNKSGLTRW